MTAQLLPPLVVAGPLALAALMLALAHALPGRTPDVIATVAALAVAAGCVALARATAGGPVTYWFGGWAPREGGLVIGIAFRADQAAATMAAFAAVLVAAALVFAWGFFDAVRAHFHVLMLLLLAAMVGFCLTGDLFDLFVWFEVMSVAAFALTGYRLEASALEGALSFTVVNTIGSYLMLAGIGLLYARAGALDFLALGRALAGHKPDLVVQAAFALIAAALLTKAALVPFQFWLADAHTVAPSPVSVIFSGIMVPLGVFGLARLTWTVFAGVAPVMAWVHGLLPALGALTAIVGGVMCLQQRHLKRLLAFSTISHVGVMVAGLGALNREGMAGLFAYVVGHGLVKGALFMVAGILLATRAGIDEIGLRGLAKHGIWPAGIVMAVAGLLLAGMPLGLMDQGADLIDAGATAAGQPWSIAAGVVGAALTGAAVLRAAGRIFLGLGPTAGEEERAPTEDEQEAANRPLWLMLAPAALLLLLALPTPDAVPPFALRAASVFMQGHAGPAAGPPHAWLPWLGVVLALLIAGFELNRKRLPRALVKGSDSLTNPPLAWLQAIHSGVVGDYVAWLVAGLAVFTLGFALG